MQKRWLKMVLALCLCSMMVSLTQAQSISSVVRRNPDTNSGDTEPQIAQDPMGNQATVFVDRDHEYEEVPGSLVGAEYIIVANDDKDNPVYELELVITRKATLYLIIDNRIGDDNKSDPPTLGSGLMNWVLDLGFTPTGDQLGIDERRDGDIDGWSAIYALEVEAGPISLYEQNDGGGRNMYAVAVFSDEPIYTAHMPTPKPGTLLNDTHVVLTWNPGDTAASHNVYLGTDYDGIVAATTDSTLYHGNQNQSSLVLDANVLDPNTTYYWRIDEVDQSNASLVHKGFVWDFSIPPRTSYHWVPEDGARNAPTQGVVLFWSPGLKALMYQVTLATDYESVANGTTESTSVLQPSFKTDALQPDTTYYWRINTMDADSQFHTGSVVSFTTAPVLNTITDASLLGHWTMDETKSLQAMDSSGHEFHGLTTGTPMWVDGAVSGAVGLNGSSHFTTPAPVDVNTNTLSVTAWIHPALVHGGPAGILFMRANENEPGTGFNLDGGNQLCYHWNEFTSDYRSNLYLPTAEWSFSAMVIEPDKASFYLNGPETVAVNTQAHDPVALTAPLIIGWDPRKEILHFGGGLDDLRLYTRALSADDISTLMGMGTVPPLAPDPLVFESFDDYRAYDADGKPGSWETWSDGFGGNGTGSALGHINAPYMELVQTLGGHQSMPIYYDNTGNFYDLDGKLVNAKYSEIEREFSPALDLTQGGSADRLVINLRGVAENQALANDRLYVIVSDGVKSAQMTVAQPEDLRKTVWQKVKIPLADMDVDTTKITSLTIGIGDKNSSAPGGVGIVYVDNLGVATSQ